MGGQTNPIASVASSVPMGNATGDLSGMSGIFSPMAAASGISPQQMALISKALGSVGGQQSAQGVAAPQLGAAQQANSQTGIVGGQSVPTVNPAYQQQMAQMLLGGR